MTAQEVRTYVGYSGWASRQVLEAALALPPEDRTKPMSVSHESIANTLAHIYFGDAIWFSRIADPDDPVAPHDALPSLDFVIEEWPRLQAKWEAWANVATDSDLALQVPFKSRFVGNAGLPAWQIVVHVVNHATPRPNRRNAAPAWHEAARDGHLVLLLRTSRACRRLARFGAPRKRRSGKQPIMIHIRRAENPQPRNGISACRRCYGQVDSSLLPSTDRSNPAEYRFQLGDCSLVIAD
jgi:uncharacterized damage-inducible protein DinB